MEPRELVPGRGYHVEDVRDDLVKLRWAAALRGGRALSPGSASRRPGPLPPRTPRAALAHPARFRAAARLAARAARALGGVRRRREGQRRRTPFLSVAGRRGMAGVSGGEAVSRCLPTGLPTEPRRERRGRRRSGRGMQGTALPGPVAGAPGLSKHRRGLVSVRSGSGLDLAFKH